jgi:hypothetical protein
MQHTQVKPSMAATNEQIGAALQVLFNSMRFPPGVDAEKAIYGYMSALQGFPVEAIAHGIRKFLRGECEDVNPKYCPHPPELAAIVRGTIRNKSPGPTGKLYGYKAPKSKIIERNCSKEWAFRLIDQGVHPRGSIWCPGDFMDRPDLGDMFAPDAEWHPAKPLAA